jgi:hypothetical protein
LLITNGLNINPEQQHRLRITGDKTLGEYNLQISDLTGDDLGSYWCERTVNNVEWVKDWKVFTTSGTYPWPFVTQIFHSDQPCHCGDRKTFEVMTST